MMLDLAYLSLEVLGGEKPLQLLTYARPFGTVAQPIDNKLKARSSCQDIGNLACKICAVVAIDGDIIDIGQINVCLFETIRNRIARKAGPMFDAPKALFFDGGEQSAVAQDACGRVGVVSIDSEDEHAARLRPWVHWRQQSPANERGPWLCVPIGCLNFNCGARRSRPDCIAKCRKIAITSKKRGELLGAYGVVPLAYCIYNALSEGGRSARRN